jgi:hypothetical protein
MTAGGGTALLSTGSPALLSEYVKDFVVDMTDFASANSVKVQIDFENKNRSYTSNNTIYLRNQFTKDTSGTASTYFTTSYAEANADKAYTNLKVSPDVTYTWPGQTLLMPFSPQASQDDGLTYSYTPVSWDLVEGEGVTVDSVTGAVTIGDDAAGTVRIRATLSDPTGASGGSPLEAYGTLYIKTYDSVRLTQEELSEDGNTCTYILEVDGTGLQPGVDNKNTPTVVKDESTVSATFQAAESEEGRLKWQVTVKRPSSGSAPYTLTVSYTINGQERTTTLSVPF